MCNEFEKNERITGQIAPYQDAKPDTSVQSMLMDYLKVKSNNARIENKYVNSLKALKLFIEPN